MLTYGITLRIIKDGEVVEKHQARRKRSIHVRIQESRVKDATYKLRVGYSDGMKNTGVYTTKKDTKHALSAFTEKGLLEMEEPNRKI